MRILVTNDDGYSAPGVHALAHALSSHDVRVVAPQNQKSACSQSITIRGGLSVSKTEFLHTWAIDDGYPADCVKLSLSGVVFDDDWMPELVLSGINQGMNTGNIVYCSGTVGAAREASFHRIPAIAFSMDSFRISNFDRAAHIAKAIVDLVGEHKMPDFCFLNVNIPCESEPGGEDALGVLRKGGPIVGIRKSRLGTSCVVDQSIRQQDGDIKLQAKLLYDSDAQEKQDDAIDLSLGYVTVVAISERNMSMAERYLNQLFEGQVEIGGLKVL
ncbi:hypothetical protein CYMTET_35273 [Cymbomonas tetramitiformis]|uniref:Survival protein SurE-like phosphatase/nucleotidase domain-containing protein n=1 Tax=Cymbomonas tetramitiformis TaxID=36881 RepID=A0AAE0F9H5_9CHLO|nr:hypothetical protein CYMTET_35273 [Cymbomonas tetramitiformis]|eukprot:gene5884-7085_t